MTKNILVTGAFGLVGSDLVPALQKKYGKQHVYALYHAHGDTDSNVQLLKGDVRDKAGLEKVIRKHKISVVYHLAGLLSVGGEKNPDLAWDVNINGLRNVLELAREYTLQVFWPSSIAAFGPTTPKTHTPQHTVIEPTTIYGITKYTGELLCQYYHNRWAWTYGACGIPDSSATKRRRETGRRSIPCTFFTGYSKITGTACF